ncbi:MAG: DNA modification methylase [Pseudomonadota bacterium]
MNSQNLERLDPAVILPRKLQWRAHSPQQISAAARLLERAGDTPIPPVVDKDGRVVFGEEFVLAAQKLRFKSITVVRSSSMSPEELRLYAINAQKIFDLGSFDEAVLGEEMKELQALLGADCLQGLAFEEGELTRLLGLDCEVAEQLDASVKVEAAPITKLGDLWEVGRHRFLCGSSLEASSFDRLMQDEKASFGFTDMPYNLSMADISSNSSREEFAFGHGEMSPDQFTRFQTTFMRLMKTHSVAGSLHAFFMSYHFIAELFRAGLIVFGRPKAMCTWVKSQPGQGSLYRSQTEQIVFFKNGDAPHCNNIQLGKHGRNRSTAWHYEGMTTASAHRDELLGLHATPKPVQLLKDAILDVTVRGDIVLDPFGGIGSVALAAEEAQRRAFAIEIEPKFVDAAIRRMRDAFGIEAIRSRDGTSFGELESEASLETNS